MKKDQIHIRDPFVVPQASERKYYLFGTTGATTWSGPGEGFDYYVSPDLDEWLGPYPAFRPPTGFWGTKNFWAPEAHFFNGNWYLFASFKSDDHSRGTQVLVADHVTGPYLPISERPQTPADWECLDGTLFVDQDGSPWMVFCHEWVQVNDGEICAMPLSMDLSRASGDPTRLFRASEAPWVTPHTPGNYVTDGPFLFRSEMGELQMIWSSFRDGSYALGIARSMSGTITGPWIQDPQPVFKEDGGHGMIFRTFEGQSLLAIHQPNQTPDERPVFIPFT